MVGNGNGGPETPEREFGPRIGRSRRLALGIVAIVIVLGFLAVVLAVDFRPASTSAPASISNRRDEPDVAFFLFGASVLVGVSVFFYFLLDRKR